MNKAEEYDQSTYWVGKEVEQTIMYGHQTLFVVGVQPIGDIQEQLDADPSIDNIFFGANQSFSPACCTERWDGWEGMITYFLHRGHWCSLDIPNTLSEKVLASDMNLSGTFIPQITVALPNITAWNHNAMLKLDDTGFDKTNPGVWCHKIQDLLNNDTFTGWSQYTLDEVIK